MLPCSIQLAASGVTRSMLSLVSKMSLGKDLMNSFTAMAVVEFLPRSPITMRYSEVAIISENLRREFLSKPPDSSAGKKSMLERVGILPFRLSGKITFTSPTPNFVAVSAELIALKNCDLLPPRIASFPANCFCSGFSVSISLKRGFFV